MSTDNEEYTGMESMLRSAFVSSKTFFIGDPRFGQAIKFDYSDPSYRYSTERDCELVRNWNKIVPVDGVVIIVGDVAFYNKYKLMSSNCEFVRDFFDHLNGSKILITNSPDLNNEWRNSGAFSYISSRATIRIDDQLIYISHHAMRDWHNRTKGAWHLFSYSDVSEERTSSLPGWCANVSLDNTNIRKGQVLAPHSFAQISQYMSENDDPSVISNMS